MAVVPQRPELARGTHVVNALLGQWCQHGVLPLGPGGGKGHTLGREQYQGHATARQQGIQADETGLECNSSEHLALSLLAIKQWGGVVQLACVGARCQCGIHIGHTLQSLLESRAGKHILAHRIFSLALVCDYGACGIEHVEITLCQAGAQGMQV